MRYADITRRLAGLGGEKWKIHAHARGMKARGADIIELTIGEPDVPTPPELIDAAERAMRAGRTGYSNGRGEPALLKALAARYSERRGRPFSADQFMCFPGTQTSLFVALLAMAGPGDEVIVGDPLYATYEALIAATGATAVRVGLRPEAGFRMQAADVRPLVTSRTRVIFINSPHNPTGAILTPNDIAALGALAREHDLWLLADEVYEELLFPGTTFHSPLDLADLADRTVAAASISKSHAAPGFRSGWCVGSPEFMARLLPLSETMLFGNQPFIADMTAEAVSAPSHVAAGMVERFARRADLIRRALHGVEGLAVHRPDAGMFALIDVRATGRSGEDFAMELLEREHVAVMPGESFGRALGGWLRVALTQPDDQIAEACKRIAGLAGRMREAA